MALDGLCSGVVGLGCVVLGGLFMYYDAWLHALFAFITAGVLIPFFYYNVLEQFAVAVRYLWGYRKYDIRIFNCFFSY